MSTHTITTIHTAALHGFSGVPVRVEADIRAGLPSLQVVGMGNKAIDEARQRVRSAILNSELQFPRQKLVINLSPAELPKDGTHYDLPIAISLLEASGQLKAKHTAQSAFVGELSLGGDILPIRGVTLLVEAAKACGATKIYLPATHVIQAQLVSDIEIIPVHTLKEVFQILRGVADPKIPEASPITIIGTPHPTIQQAFMQRALTIATMNPCPCGYYQDTEKACICSQGQINAYKKKLSGPLLDRVDLFIYVPRAPDEYFFDTKTLQETQQRTDTKLIQSISNLQKAALQA